MLYVPVILSVASLVSIEAVELVVGRAVRLFACILPCVAMLKISYNSGPFSTTVTFL